MLVKENLLSNLTTHIKVLNWFGSSTFLDPTLQKVINKKKLSWKMRKLLLFVFILLILWIQIFRYKSQNKGTTTIYTTVESMTWSMNGTIAVIFIANYLYKKDQTKELFNFMIDFERRFYKETGTRKQNLIIF